MESSRHNISPNARRLEQQNSEDEDEEGKDAKESEQTSEVIDAWLGEPCSTKSDKISIQQQHSARIDVEPFKMGGSDIPIPDAAKVSMEWDAWAKYGGLPTPHHHSTNNLDTQALQVCPSEATAMNFESHLELRSSLLLSQSVQHPSSSLSSSYLHGSSEVEPRGHAQTQTVSPPYVLQGKSI